MKTNEEIVKFITDTLQETKSFVVEQSPEVVQQYLGFRITENLIGMITCLSMLLIGVYLILKFIRLSRDSSYKSDLDIIIFPGVALSLVSIGLGFMFVIQFIHVYYYPKAYLLHKFLL